MRRLDGKGEKNWCRKTYSFLGEPFLLQYAEGREKKEVLHESRPVFHISVPAPPKRESRTLRAQEVGLLTFESGGKQKEG